MPLAPGDPHTTASNGRVALHWSPSVDNGSAITRYVVSPGVDGVQQKARTYNGHTTTATITGLENGKAFRSRSTR